MDFRLMIVCKKVTRNIFREIQVLLSKVIVLRCKRNVGPISTYLTQLPTFKPFVCHVKLK